MSCHQPRLHGKVLPVSASVDSKATCGAPALDGLLQQGAKFGTIYADPPWRYNNRASRGAACNHYDTMTVEEICALPICELAATDAHLHLWVTNAFLFEAPRIFQAWGFEYRSELVWCKPQMGVGNYWRNSHEKLLTAVRGKATRFDDRGLQSWLICRRGAHSAKPEQVRAYIERASPAPYLELFGRRQIPGWTVWGNEIIRDQR
jgi:N6-adenosine-specific RNA methylase IME4